MAIARSDNAPSITESDPITPAEAASIVEKEMQQRVDSVYSILNQRIVASLKRNEHPATASLKVDAKHLEYDRLLAIAEAYKKQGWEARVEVDGREQYQINISEPTTAKSGRAS